MSLRQSMSGLHTWGGLLPSWLLFVIFFAGSLACFDKELERWMRPALHQPGVASLTADQVRDWLHERAPNAHAWWMRSPSEREPFWWAGWEPEEIEDLRAYLNRLSETPSIQKVYLSEVVDHGIGREVTIAIDASRIAA